MGDIRFFKDKTHFKFSETKEKLLVMHKELEKIENLQPDTTFEYYCTTMKNLISSGVSKLDSRTLIRNLERLDLVSPVIVEVGKQRVSRFVCKHFEKDVSSQMANYQREKRKFDELLSTSQSESSKRPKIEKEIQNVDSAMNEVNEEEEEHVVVVEKMDESFKIPESRRKSDMTSGLEKTSTKKLQRANAILALVRKQQVIDDPTKIHHHIQDMESSEGYDSKMDKKSLLRLLMDLAQGGHIRIIPMKLQLGVKEKVLHFVCDNNIDEHHSVIRSAVEQAKMKFSIPGRTEKKRVAVPDSIAETMSELSKVSYM